MNCQLTGWFAGYSPGSPSQFRRTVNSADSGNRCDAGHNQEHTI